MGEPSCFLRSRRRCLRKPDARLRRASSSRRSCSLNLPGPVGRASADRPRRRFVERRAVLGLSSPSGSPGVPTPRPRTGPRDREMPGTLPSLEPVPVPPAPAGRRGLGALSTSGFSMRTTCGPRSSNFCFSSGTPSGLTSLGRVGTLGLPAAPVGPRIGPVGPSGRAGWPGSPGVPGTPGAAIGPAPGARAAIGGGVTGAEEPGLLTPGAAGDGARAAIPAGAADAGRDAELAGPVIGPRGLAGPVIDGAAGADETGLR